MTSRTRDDLQVHCAGNDFVHIRKITEERTAERESNAEGGERGNVRRPIPVVVVVVREWNLAAREAAEADAVSEEDRARGEG